MSKTDVKRCVCSCKFSALLSVLASSDFPCRMAVIKNGAVVSSQTDLRGQLTDSRKHFLPSVSSHWLYTLGLIWIFKVWNASPLLDKQTRDFYAFIERFYEKIEDGVKIRSTTENKFLKWHMYNTLCSDKQMNLHWKVRLPDRRFCFIYSDIGKSLYLDVTACSVVGLSFLVSRCVGTSGNDLWADIITVIKFRVIGHRKMSVLAPLNVLSRLGVVNCL